MSSAFSVSALFRGKYLILSPRCHKFQSYFGIFGNLIIEGRKSISYIVKHVLLIHAIKNQDNIYD